MISSIIGTVTGFLTKAFIPLDKHLAISSSDSNAEHAIILIALLL